MESFGNEIKVQQGEDWSLDLLISASSKEYIPYIVSSERTNPYFIVTVASTKYEKNRRYVKSWWNSIDDSSLPRFYSTRPIFYGNLETVADLPNGVIGDSKDERYLYQYTLDYIEADVDENTIGTYYIYDDGEWKEKALPAEYVEGTTYYKKEEINKDLGHKPYYYFYFNYSNGVPSLPSRVDSYECRLRQHFATEDTSEWGSQNYLYQITLVSGQTMEDRLEEIYNHYHPANWPDNIEAQYKYVKINYPDALQPDIDIDSPLGYIEAPDTVLQPTHLEVYNNLRKLI